MVSLERKGALDERDALVSQLYKEIEETKRLEKEVCRNGWRCGCVEA